MINFHILQSSNDMLVHVSLQISHFSLQLYSQEYWQEIYIGHPIHSFIFLLIL
jgi:hypothetical protein